MPTCGAARWRHGTAGLAGCAVLVVACAGSGAGGGDLDGTSFSGEVHDVRVEVVADGFSHPWGLAFLPEGKALVTERSGPLNLVNPASGDVREVAGAPAVAAVGQGGLLDVALHPDYPEAEWIYLTWSAGAGGDGGYLTHVGRARLDVDAARLDDLEVLITAHPDSMSTQHFGSRLAFDAAGYLYVTSGDRGARDRAQDRTNLHGATLRLTAEGGIPADNPWIDDPDVADALYSYGHRNAQGMAVHPDTGDLWQSEHGPRAGDEINRIVAGGNHGWPLATYGREYGLGSAIGIYPHEDPDIVDPLHYWQEASFAPSGLAFYDADRFPEWQGDVFVGSLVRTNLTRLRFDGDEVIAEEALLDDAALRIRDVRVGPSGYLHLLVDADPGAWLRLVPD